MSIGKLFSTKILNLLSSEMYRYAEPNTLNSRSLASSSLICDSMDELECQEVFTKRVQWDFPVSTVENTTEKHTAVANIRLSSDKGIVNCKERNEKDASLYNGNATINNVLKNSNINKVRENLFAFDDMENVEVMRPVVIEEENNENDQDIANKPTKISMSPAGKKG
jgi:hypothetical protein